MNAQGHSAYRCHRSFSEPQVSHRGQRVLAVLAGALVPYLPLLLLSGCGIREADPHAARQSGEVAAAEEPGAQDSVEGRGSAGSAAPGAGVRLPLGALAPMTDIPMKNVDERDVTIDAVAGEKGTLVVFTCNHCPWAQAWEGRLTELGNRYQQQGIGVIAINANDTDRFPGDAFQPMQARANAAGMEFPYAVDATSRVARAFGAQKTPEAFLFDQERRLVYRGAIDDNANEPDKVQERYLQDALEALVNGSPIERAETDAIGCSIKLRPA